MPLSRRQLLLALGSSTALALIPKLEAASTVRIVEFDSAGNSKGTADGRESRQEQRRMAQAAQRRSNSTSRAAKAPNALHRQVRQESRGRHLPLHLLRDGAVQLRDQIRIRHRLAQLLGPIAKENVANKTDHSFGIAHGSEMHPLRRSSGPRVRRWTEAHRLALLHELRGLEF